MAKIAFHWLGLAIFKKKPPSLVTNRFNDHKEILELLGSDQGVNKVKHISQQVKCN